MANFGLTGNIGAGKSRIGRWLERCLGYARLDADAVGRELLLPGNTGWLQLREQFGGRFFLPDETVDRVRLRKAIFADPELRHGLESLLQPLIAAAIVERQQRFARQHPQGIMVVEVPLLFEAGWQHLFDGVILVVASNAVRCRRLMERDHLSAEEAETALAAQQPQQGKIALADYVIENSGSWGETCRQLYRLGEKLSPCK